MLSHLKLAARTHPFGTVSLCILVVLIALRVWWTWGGPLRLQVWPVNCDDLMETAQRKALAGQMQKPDELPAAIAAQYGLPEEKISLSRDATTAEHPHRTYFQWTTNNRDHAIVLNEPRAAADIADMQDYQWVIYDSRQ